MRAAFLSVRAPPPLFPFCAGREYIPHRADGPSPVRRLFPGCAACTRDAVCGFRTTESCRRNFKIRLFELLLTRLIEIPIVRPPFGKSTDFLESIPSKFLIFFKVHPRPALSTSVLKSTTGKCCRYSPAVNLRPLRKGSSKMKRLSLLLVAFAFLTTASGCCCGLFHGGCNSCGYPASPCGCGYAPAYPAPPPCGSCGGGGCPTCPGGGCGVNQGIPQGAFYDGDSMNRAALSSNVGYGATPAASLAAAERTSTY
jgi:hypothetical protein